MPTVMERGGTYLHNFTVVSASHWDKYEGHDVVKEWWTLSRKVDERGRLHVSRLVTMLGNPPRLFKPFFGTKPFFLLETVVVDVEEKRMEVTTRNINFVKFLNSSSTSVYTPNKENDKHTDYQITIRTSAFPGESNSWVHMGGVARALEEFVSKKLMGNVKKGEVTVKNWATTMRKACMLGDSNSRLCRDLVGE